MVFIDLTMWFDACITWYKITILFTASWSKPRKRIQCVCKSQHWFRACTSVIYSVIFQIVLSEEKQREREYALPQKIWQKSIDRRPDLVYYFHIFYLIWLAGYRIKTCDTSPICQSRVSITKSACVLCPAHMCEGVRECVFGICDSILHCNDYAKNCLGIGCWVSNILHAAGFLLSSTDERRKIHSALPSVTTHEGMENSEICFFLQCANVRVKHYKWNKFFTSSVSAMEGRKKRENIG